MGSHAPWARHFITNEGLSMKEGSSFNLTKGQFGIIDTGAAPTKRGLKVTTVFPKAPKDRLFELSMGVAPISVNRSQSNKRMSSMPFKLSEVVDIRVNAPTEQGIHVDELIVGYDGINEDTALTLNTGDSEVIDITLMGTAIGMLGYDEGKVTVQLYLEAPLEGEKGVDWFMEEIILDAVERLKNMTLVGGVPITEYIDIRPVNSTNDASVTGTDFTFQTLTLTDNGDYTSLAKVQAQYPEYEVKRKEFVGEQSVYVIMAEDGTSLDNYTTGIASLIKDCEDCPSGYSEMTEGFVYRVNIEDNEDPDATNTTIEAISTNVVANSSRRVYEDVYTVVTGVKLTDAEINAFVTTNPEATVEIISDNVATLCANSSTSSYTWVEGDTCTALEETYTIQLKNDNCDGNRLAELQDAYPDLTIVVEQGGEPAADVTGGCQTKYSTTVMTDVVCEECDPILRDMFMSEAPDSFDRIDWRKEEPTYTADALMGIYLRGKESLFAGNEQFRDEIPSFYTSTRISVAGGYPTTISENFNAGRNGRFNVKLLDVATEAENLGMDFYDWEDRSNVYFNGRQRLEGNNYGKWVLGQETHLKPTAQYVDYIIRIETNRYAQSFAGKVEENFDYHVVAEVGRHQDIEDILNALAAAAGLEPVQAFAVQEA